MNLFMYNYVYCDGLFSTELYVYITSPQVSIYLAHKTSRLDMHQH